jgi:hypothetical protein
MLSLDPHFTQLLNKVLVLIVAFDNLVNLSKGFMLEIAELWNFLGLAKLSCGKDATTLLFTIIFRSFPYFLNTFFAVPNFNFKAKVSTHEYLSI